MFDFTGGRYPPDGDISRTPSFMSLENQNFLHFPMGMGQSEDNIASVLRNFWPTLQGAVMRGGCRKICSLQNKSRVTSAFSYNSESQQRIFLANHQEIYDVTYASLQEPVSACVSEMKSGDWSTFQHTTPEQTFLIAVNGRDKRQIYDGKEWISDLPHMQMNFEGHDNMSSEQLFYGWLFKNRQWYIASESMDAWYLPIRCLGGTAKLFPLGGVMQKGGSLLAGFAWSTESGNGLSTFCVFLSTMGEVAVYAGDDPEDASSFSLKALYHIGRPLGKNAIAVVKNDVWIATINGLISMKSILLREGKEPFPLSWAIQEEWNQAIMAAPTGWVLTLWEKRNMLLVSCPQNPILSDKTFVMNVSNHHYWAIFHNWLTQSYVVSKESLFFGDYEGGFWQGDVTGSDDHKPFFAAYLSPFREFISPYKTKKRACLAHITVQSCFRPYLKLFARADYDTSHPNFSKVTVNNNFIQNGIWDNSLWDDATWTDDLFVKKKSIFHFCQNVMAYGHFLAVGCVIVSAGKWVNDIQIDNTKLLVE
ncbi:MAG: hypothetical protein EU981_02575 [Candidatus Liberibacter ctenarytainae]|uniref:Uncharacterized protein n=1 Tax=Candidatus Liberibacter ctenarytainae TaxID=2020335 RepID=A0A937AJ19_9HYPH|nr:hypothetical protein [Candidatus Liberibacter ctenarytainae]